MLAYNTGCKLYVEHILEFINHNSKHNYHFCTVYSCLKLAFLTERLKTEILIIVGYGDKKNTQEEACELFNSLYPNSQISCSTVFKVCSMFMETGSVATKRKNGQPRSVVTE